MADPAPQPFAGNGQQPLRLRSSFARVQLAKILANVSESSAALDYLTTGIDLHDHPAAQQLFLELATARKNFALFYRNVGRALAYTAPEE